MLDHVNQLLGDDLYIAGSTGNPESPIDRYAKALAERFSNHGSICFVDSARSDEKASSPTAVDHLARARALVLVVARENFGSEYLFEQLGRFRATGRRAVLLDLGEVLVGANEKSLRSGLPAGVKRLREEDYESTFGPSDAVVQGIEQYLSLREKGTDLFILLSRSALLPIFDPPSNDRLYCANESFGSCQLPPLQRFADQLPLVYGYRTPHEFPVARCPFIVGNP